MNDLLKGLSKIKKDILIIQRYLRIKYKIYIDLISLKRRIDQEK